MKLKVESEKLKAGMTFYFSLSIFFFSLSNTRRIILARFLLITGFSATPFCQAVSGECGNGAAGGIFANWRDFRKLTGFLHIGMMQKLRLAAPFLHSVLSGSLRGVRKWSRRRNFRKLA